MPKCCRCEERALWAVRIAFPARGTAKAAHWLYTMDHLCQAHKTTTPALDLLPDEWRPLITARMAPAEPDFQRAYLEWMRV